MVDRDVLKTIADSFLTIANCFNKLSFVNPATSTPTAPLSEGQKEEVEEKTLTFEDVRGALVKKSQDGFTQKVKECLTKFGASKLSDVKQSDYKALLSLVEESCGDKKDE